MKKDQTYPVKFHRAKVRSKGRSYTESWQNKTDELYNTRSFLYEGRLPCGVINITQAFLSNLVGTSHSTLCEHLILDGFKFPLRGSV